jgi:hypothetical protein
MFSFTPNSPLSNLWSIKELLPDEVDAGSIRERWDAARKNLCLAHDSVRRKYNRNRRHPPFQVGSQVWLRNFPVSKAGHHISAKLSPRYKGPYIIAEFTNTAKKCSKPNQVSGNLDVENRSVQSRWPRANPPVDHQENNGSFQSSIEGGREGRRKGRVGRRNGGCAEGR